MSVDLTKFCAPRYEPRKYMRQPFLLAGVGTVALKSYFAIVITSDAAGTTADVPPTMADTFKNWRETVMAATGGIKAADIQLPDPIKCDECDGTGNVTGTDVCEECDGDGFFDHYSHEYECQNCGGTGKAQSEDAEPDSCHACDGTGEGFQTMAVGDTHFNVRCVKWIAELPDAQIFTNGMQTGFFTFTGGWGAVMPCRT